MRVRVGCCGFPMAQARYFQRFDTVEVQQTFYDPPRLATLERWRAAAPSGFAFTVKAWQVITHEATSPTYRRLRRPLDPRALGRVGGFRLTPEVLSAWATTLACARALAAPIIVFQSPASFSATRQAVARLEAFFDRIRADADSLTLAWEPRGWPDALAQETCDALGLVRVVDPFRDAPPPHGLRYFRLHGITGYGYRYTDADLARLRDLCHSETWCLFNNTAMGEDAARFLALLGAPRMDKSRRILGNSRP